MTKKKKPSERKKLGRPTTYKKKYCWEMIAHFDVEATEEIVKEVITKTGVDSMTVEVATRLPTYASYARSIGCHRQKLYEWAAKFPEFKDAMAQCKTIQLDLMIENGLAGRYQSSFAILAMKNMQQWTDRQEIDTNQSINITIDKDDEKL